MSAEQVVPAAGAASAASTTSTASAAGVNLDAILLAGGAGRRLGGLDKASIRLGGIRLVDRVVSAAKRAGAARIVVVGPEHAASDGSVSVREDPPGSGPLAGVAAALPSVTAEWVLLLPCDLVHPDTVCETLGLALPELAAPAGVHDGTPDGAHEGACDGILLRDESGRRQWLAGIYSAAMLRRAVGRLGGELANRPLRVLFEGARLREIELGGGLSGDIDTPDELRRASESLD